MGTSENLSHMVKIESSSVEYHHPKVTSGWYTFKATIDNVPVQCKCILIYNSRDKVRIRGIRCRLTFDKPITAHPDYKIIKQLIFDDLKYQPKFKHSYQI